MLKPARLIELARTELRSSARHTVLFYEALQSRLAATELLSNYRCAQAGDVEPFKVYPLRPTNWPMIMLRHVIR